MRSITVIHLLIILLDKSITILATKMMAEIVSMGPYEVLAWPDQLGSLGVGRYSMSTKGKIDKLML